MLKNIWRGHLRELDFTVNLCLELRTSTLLFGLLLYIVRTEFSDLYKKVEKRGMLSFVCLAALGSSLLFTLIVPTSVVFLANNFVASDMLVKKLSVVTFLPQFVYGSVSFRTTCSLRSIDDGRCSSFPKQGNPFKMYLLLTSDASQILCQICWVY